MSDIDLSRPRRLAKQLRAEGEIKSREWEEAFAQVPREVFIPCFATYGDGERSTAYRLYDGANAAQRDAWLDLVYSDTTLITQIGGGAVEDVIGSNGTTTGHATSSSTAPGLMARLLEALDLHEGHDVLEVGTGTGFNAGVLSQRLGAQHVTSIDIDPDLTGKARHRLGTLGLNPGIHTTDGREGWADAGPYDRIIATCSTPNVPYTWVEQTRPGGKILANIAGPLAGAMALLDAAENGTAQGRFLRQWAGFMWARPGFTKVGDIRAQDTEEGTYDTSAPTMDVGLLQNQAFTFVLQLALPDARPYWARNDKGSGIHGLITTDGSWTEHITPVDGSSPVVEQGGPRRLWDQVEKTHQWWQEHDRPDWSAFGVTVSEERQAVWFESPTTSDWWLLPQ